MLCTLPASWVTSGKHAPQCPALGELQVQVSVCASHLNVNVAFEHIWGSYPAVGCTVQTVQTISYVASFFCIWCECVHLETDSEVIKASEGRRNILSPERQNIWRPSWLSANTLMGNQIKSIQQSCCHVLNFVWNLDCGQFKNYKSKSASSDTALTFWHVSDLLHWNLIVVLLLPIIAVSHSGMPPPVPAQEPSESQSLQRMEMVRGWWQLGSRQSWFLCVLGTPEAGHLQNVDVHCSGSLLCNTLMELSTMIQ